MLGTDGETNPVSLPRCDSSFPTLGRDPRDFAETRYASPRAMFVFDTETRTDATQRFTFGSYRFFIDAELQEEGLFLRTTYPSRIRETSGGLTIKASPSLTFHCARRRTFQGSLILMGKSSAKNRPSSCNSASIKNR